MGEANFKRVHYSKPSKDLQPLSSFDPRPLDNRGNAVQDLPRLLEQVKGKGLCVSLLFDPDTAVSYTKTFTPSSKEVMQQKIIEFKLLQRRMHKKINYRLEIPENGLMFANLGSQHHCLESSN